MARLLLLFVLGALIAPASAPARPQPEARWCSPGAVCKRPAMTHRERVARREWRHAQRVRRHMLRVIAPYRPWLRSTGACESGAGYDLRSGLRAYNPSPFYGRYQFTMGTWRSVGGRGDPRNAGWLEQAYRAVLVVWSQGRGAWPVCG